MALKKQIGFVRKISIKGFVFGSLLFGGLLAAGSGSGLFVVSDALAQDADAVVKFRKALMQETKASLQAMSLLLRGEVADKESVALQAQILALASARAGEAFVFRTRGLTESTTAHQRVWTEQAKFRKKMEAFAKDAKAFADLASRKASAAPTKKMDKEMASALKGLARQCKSCHDRYRVENDR